jgi:hypothetical protein
MDKSKLLSSNKVTKVPKSALLAGAALGLPLAAHADIQFVNLQQTITSDATNPSFGLDLDGDGTIDFTFTAGLISDTVTPGTGNGYVGTDTNNPTPLASGASIDSTDTFQTGQGVLQNTKQKKYPFNKRL